MDGQKLYSWDEENKQKQQQDMNINVLEDPQEILEAKNMLDTMNQQDLLKRQDEQNKQVQADPALMDKREELVNLAGQVINGIMSSDSSFLLKAVDRTMHTQAAKVAVDIAVDMQHEIDKHYN